MGKRHSDHMMAAPSSGAAGTARALDPVPSETTHNSPKHDQIAALAYSYWEARGFQGGSPEEDWDRAEQELARKDGEVNAS